MDQETFESVIVFIADIGPFLTYLIVDSFLSLSTTCFVATGVGVVGSALGYYNLYYLNPKWNRVWPNLLNTSEMILYLGMGLLILFASSCKMWSVLFNFIFF